MTTTPSRAKTTIPLPIFAIEPNPLPTSSYSLVRSLKDESKHPHFWFDDGDTVLFVGGLYFRIHSSKVFPLSKTLIQGLEQTPKIVHKRGFYFLPHLKCGPTAWACLLGLIYNKKQATTNPTFQELLMMVGVTATYRFTNIHRWALARMRFDFLRDPEHMQCDTGEEETVEHKLHYAMKVFHAWWFPRIDFNNRTLAIYAVARLDLASPQAKELKDCMLPPMWRIIEDARTAMRLQYEEIRWEAAGIATRYRNSVSHPSRPCGKYILDWMEDALERDPDTLRVLRDLRHAHPRGPICRVCIREVRLFLGKAYNEMLCNLPIYMGCHSEKVENWDIHPTLLDTDRLLSPL